MTNTELVSIAEKSLDRTLGFFSRVDSKGSVLLAINTTMVAVLGGNVEIPSSVTTKFRMGMTTTTIDIQLC